MNKLITDKNLGITLIALVITIVLLIILAAVAINLSLGNNGILNRAKTAKEQYQNAQDLEKTKIRKSTNDIDSHIDSSRGELEELKKENELLNARIEELESNQVKMYYLGAYNSATSNTINVSSYDGYESFTQDNFIYCQPGLSITQATSPDDRGGKISMSYNNQTGVLTTGIIGDCTKERSGKSWRTTITFDVYLITGHIEKINS